MPDFELLDITYAAEGDDEPRPKVGDQASGQGVGQDCAFFGVDGFVSIPNPPDASGGCAQAVAMTIGNDRCVIGSLDGRYTAKAGTLSPGDRAVVSNCDARLVLSQSGNAIGLYSTGMSCVLDGAAQTLRATSGGMSVQLAQGSPDSLSLALSQGSVSASLSITGTGVTLSYASPGGSASLALSSVSGGQVAITAHGGVLVNGVPLVVP